MFQKEVANITKQNEHQAASGRLVMTPWRGVTPGDCSSHCGCPSHRRPLKGLLPEGAGGTQPLSLGAGERDTAWEKGDTVEDGWGLTEPAAALDLIQECPYELMMYF